MKNILLLTVAIFIGSHSIAKAEILNFDYTPQIEFNSTKPNWYHSKHQNFDNVEIPSFKISLQTSENTNGAWSMQFIDTNQSKIKPKDISSRLLYLGMRFQFE